MKPNYQADVAEMLKLRIVTNDTAADSISNSLVICDLWWVWREDQLWWDL